MPTQCTCLSEQIRTSGQIRTECCPPCRNDHQTLHQDMNACNQNEDLLIFGYGSLIFKTNFPYVSWEPAFVTGFTRVLYQASTDHRGVPGRPGRMWTLLPGNAQTDFATGILYRIEASDVPTVLEQLDFREKCGYDKFIVPCYSFDKNSQDPFSPVSSRRQLTTQAVIYMGTENGDEYLGPGEGIDDIANHVIRSCGPSGPNSEYVLQTSEALRQLGMLEFDAHVRDLERNIIQKLLAAAAHEIQTNKVTDTGSDSKHEIISDSVVAPWNRSVTEKLLSRTSEDSFIFSAEFPLLNDTNLKKL